ncbi:variable surface protein, partial [Plasmodium gonderi]
MLPKMRDNIYLYINLFPVCQEAIDQCAQDSENKEDEYCKKVLITIPDIKSTFNEKCPIAFLYLNKIEEKSYTEENIKGAACIYMYYWIYHDLLKNNKNGINAKILYEAFIQAYNEVDIEKYNGFKGANITVNELNNLKYIYEMETELKNMEKDKESSSGNKCESAKKCSDLYMQ